MTTEKNEKNIHVLAELANNNQTETTNEGHERTYDGSCLSLRNNSFQLDDLSELDIDKELDETYDLESHTVANYGSPPLRSLSDVSSRDSPHNIESFESSGDEYDNIDKHHAIFSNQSPRMINIDRGVGGETNIENLELEQLIDDYKKYPIGKFTLRGIYITELPERFERLDQIKHLEIIDCGLDNLEHLPSYVETLIIKNNNIRKLLSKDLPYKLRELNVMKNKIDVIDLSQLPHLKKLNISHNPVSNIIEFPANVEELTATNTNINDCKHFSNLKKLKILKINRTQITNIDTLPDNIQELSIAKLDFEKNGGVISKLPEDLRKLIAYGSKIKKFKFDAFPNWLIEIDLYDNELIIFPKMNSIMRDVDISNNKLEYIANIPDYIEKFDIKCNPQIKLSDENKKDLIRLKLYTNADLKIDVSLSLVGNTKKNDQFTQSRLDAFKLRDNRLRMRNDTQNIMQSISRFTKHDGFVPSKMYTHKIYHKCVMSI